MTKPLLIPWIKERAPGQIINGQTTPPKIVYRYLGIARVESTITGAQLWFSAPKDFNDPFDMHPGLIDSSLTKADIEAYIDLTEPLRPKPEKEAMTNWLHKNPGVLKEAQRSWLENARSTFGVCCFSRFANTGLMWSHYTSSHQGVCFGFNFEPFPTSETPTLFQPVNYTNKIVPQKTVTAHGSEEAIKAIGHWLLTKSDIWRYEQEVRGILMHKNGLINFDKSCLREIYFGCQVEQDKIDELMSLLKNYNYHDVRCFKMVLDSAIFDIKPIELEPIN